MYKACLFLLMSCSFWEDPKVFRSKISASMGATGVSRLVFHS